jgi:hypothetical protein
MSIIINYNKNMAETFKAKVRNVGTSFGILIPKEIIEKEKVKAGDVIQVSILRPNLEEIMKFFGSAKNASKFKRNHEERV